MDRRNFALAAASLMLFACGRATPETAAPALTATPPTAPPARALRTVAVELFTSQGCSSCPPADEVLQRIASEPGVVVMSRPVTYWDRLGWPDTLARSENDQRQFAYARRMRLDDYYTPQAVVQGGAQLIGSHEARLRTRIAEARRASGPALSVERGGVRIAGGRTGGPAEVRVVALRSRADVAIRRGENAGRRIRYTNVVIDEQVIGRWSGGAALVPVPARAIRVAGADRYAVIVQAPEGGPILAATYL